MKRSILGLAVFAMLYSTVAFAANAKAYQVTGPVTAVKDGMIEVQKGSEKWQLNLTDKTTALGVKVGDKVTISYTMNANIITVKSAPMAPKKKK